MITATPIRNAGPYRPVLKRGRNGYTGRDYYLIDGATDIDQCLDAVGLPQQGAAWSAALPQLKASEFEPVPYGGDNFYVVVDYAEDQAGSVTPAEGLVITTEMTVERASERIRFDVSGEVDLGEDGTSKLQVALGFVVRAYSANLPNLEGPLGLADEPKINEDGVTLRNLYGSGQNLGVAPERLLYAGFSVGRQGDFFYLQHELLYRRSWKFGKPARGTDGVPNGNILLVDIYEKAPFTGIV